MIKLLHSADWHLDAPLSGFSPEQARYLRDALSSIPHKVATLCRAEGCQLLMLGGDLFDGCPKEHTVSCLREALEEAGCPVFIAPGNHDFISPESPWLRVSWPGNVHIFTRPEITSTFLPELDCRIYGAGYTGMDCPGLLEGFAPERNAAFQLGLFHGDPTGSSPYCPITAAQVSRCGLDYLALGHIHKAGSLRKGSTLCAWPGAPMGRGWDEPGDKGVYLVQLEEDTQLRQVSLGLPRFFDLSAQVSSTPAAALEALLPAAASQDFYRITLTGSCEPFSAEALASAFPGYPNLLLRDRTQAPTDCFRSAGEDSLEGVFFGLLKEIAESASGREQKIAVLAGEISRKILDGQEVIL